MCLNLLSSYHMPRVPPPYWRSIVDTRLPSHQSSTTVHGTTPAFPVDTVDPGDFSGGKSAATSKRKAAIRIRHIQRKLSEWSGYRKEQNLTNTKQKVPVLSHSAFSGAKFLFQTTKHLRMCNGQHIHSNISDLTYLSNSSLVCSQALYSRWQL